MNIKKENAGIFAKWTMIRKNKYTDEIIDIEEGPNTIVNNGLNLLRDLAGNLSSPNALTAIAIGTGTTGATTSDTALETEYTRLAATVSANGNYVLRLTKTFTFGSGVSEDISEAGIFDSATASGSTMFNRYLPASAKSVTEAISLIVTCDITFSRV